MKISCKIPSTLSSRLLNNLWHRVNGHTKGEGSTGSGLIVLHEPRPVTLAYNSFERLGSRSGAQQPPVLMLHGFYGRRKQFRDLAIALHAGCEGRRKIFVLDARNHGESPHTLTHTIEDQVEDVLRFMRKHDMPSASLVGHSMGARTAMTIALKYPSMVESCIVLDASASPSTVTGTSRLFFDALRSVTIPSHLNATDGRIRADRQLRQLLPHQIQRDFVLDNLIKTSSGSFDWQLNFRMLEQLHDASRKFWLPQNKQFLGPSLFVKGAHSNEMDPHQLLSTRRLFPSSQFRIIEDAGHLVHIEQTYRLQKFLLTFFNAINVQKKTE